MYYPGSWISVCSIVSLHVGFYLYYKIQYEIPRSKPNQGSKGPLQQNLLNTKERYYNKKKYEWKKILHKIAQKPHMFLCQKNVVKNFNVQKNDLLQMNEGYVIIFNYK